jgi:hypothetical protein
MVEPEVPGHRRVGDAAAIHVEAVEQMGVLVTRPRYTLRPLSRWGSSASARWYPLSANASAKGSVALLRAKAAVRATAPGMLLTQ